MADDSETVGQDEIEKLLRESKAGESSKPAQPPPKASGVEGAALGQEEIEALLSGAGQGSPKPPQAKPAPKDDDNRILGQGDIESMLSSARPPGRAAKAGSAPPSAASAPAAGEAMAQGDIEFLLKQAESALASVDSPTSEIPSNVLPFTFEELTGAPPSTEVATLELIRDVELDLRIELGRTHMHLEEVLKLRKGSVVPLDKLAGDPVDIFANGRLIARGEVLVLNDNFCIRVAELIAGETAKAG